MDTVDNLFHATNVLRMMPGQQIARMAGSTQRGILEIAKEKTMRLFGHVMRHPEDLELAHAIMHGIVPGNRAQSRPRRNGPMTSFGGLACVWR